MTAPTASSITIATGSAALTGAVFGLQYDALLHGLLGGLIALQHLGTMRRSAVVASLATAVIIAGALAPVAVAAAAEYAPWTAKIPPTPARIACALLLGLTCQTLIPLMFAGIRTLAAKFGIREDDGGAT